MQVKYEHWLVIRVLKVWKASKVKYCTFSFHSPTDGSHHYHSNENATAHCHGGSKQANLTIPLIVKLFLRKASVRFHSTHIIPPGPPPLSNFCLTRGCKQRVPWSLSPPTCCPHLWASVRGPTASHWTCRGKDIVSGRAVIIPPLAGPTKGSSCSRGNQA